MSAPSVYCLQGLALVGTRKHRDTLELCFLFPSIDVYRERNEMTLQSLTYQSHEPHHTKKRSNELTFLIFLLAFSPLDF